MFRIPNLPLQINSIFPDLRAKGENIKSHIVGRGREMIPNWRPRGTVIFSSESPFFQHFTYPKSWCQKGLVNLLTWRIHEANVFDPICR